ncbi:angiotensin-converting enzyme-like isoform X4 [Anopheles merus]|uniref:angiotensin-converting enzyme-like isoform X4 n=1 Tax=Anopheles merus TaxID=30066 RepID=UPI001BE3D490|nr:angiotensin-converting enzyme-like isoform X4 [Anopheles merus]
MANNIQWRSVWLMLLFASTIAAGPVKRRSTEGEKALSETEISQIVEWIEQRYQQTKARQTLAAWEYGSNLTEFNLSKKTKAAADFAEVAKAVAEELQQFKTDQLTNATLKRRIKKLAKLGYAVLPADQFKELLAAIASMESNYAKAKFCAYGDATKCDLSLDPELTEIFANHREPEELKYYWVQWYNATGVPVRESFQKYVELNRQAALRNNFSSGAAVWLNEYDDSTFEQQIDDVIEQIRPLYEQLHAYVRYKLRQKYGDKLVSPTGPIPMHLLGNLWAQTWDNIADFTTPFPEKKLLDVTDEMIRQGYTPIKMFQMGDDFFTSLNMTKLPQTFWEKSILEKPADGRDLVCHASAWDFFAIDDVRIKQCTRVNMREFFVVHHELGHIQYYLQYQHQPVEFRGGANPGFHEAVGDVLSLSVSTPKHLKKVGLLKDYEEDEQVKINQFYRAGVTKLVFLPFAYTLDKYRWGVFRGDIKPRDMVLPLLLLLTFGASIGATDPELERNELAAQRYVIDLEPEILARNNNATELSWAYESNITEEALKQRNEAASRNANFFKEVARELRLYDYSNFKDADLKRRIKKLTDLGYAALDETKFSLLVDAISRMQENYATAKVCQYKNESNCNYGLEPELTETLAKSRDPEELKHYWVQWHEVSGKPVRKDFDEYVALNREAAQLNNFTSGAEYWLDAYEDDTFEAQVDAAIEQIRPLYEQIHAYVRYKLRKHYGNDIVSEKGPIPIHLLGNMWGQTWDNIADITTPFPNKKLLDVTEEMVRQGYTPLKMFQMGDEFFQSLNMTKLPSTFWEKSILEKPNDGRELVCHASAWDFYKKDDVRIKQCTRVNMEDFFTVHHELGHIQYYLQYQHLPSVYREGANPGFHEAVGDVLSLSVSTPKHLEKIGLLKDYVEDEESKLNQFYQAGLAKLVFLPFAYTLDKYRWEIFRGDVKPEHYNCKFWEMRTKYSGVEPPVERSESDFDAAAKYHVSADVEYLRYFVSYIVQFQFHRAACEKAGQYVKGDLEKTVNNCDIYQSAEAGNALKAMLAMGSSKPWPDAMEVLTGQRKMSADALIEYFQPLYDWLVKENKALGAHVGWEEKPKCKSA